MLSIIFGFIKYIYYGGDIMEIISIKNLTKKYKHKYALNGIDIKVEQGEIIGLLGPNGAGKSTLISILVGLTKKTGGRIVYEKTTILQRKWRKNIGYVPQDFAVYEDLSAEENIRFFCSLYGYRGKALKERVYKALKFVGLYDVRGEFVKNFSGGMKRRLNIGCAISHSPKLLIMDEPTVGIDPQSKNHIIESVKKLNEEGVTIIYASHHIEEIDEIASRIIIMDNGKVIANGTGEELKILIEKMKIIKVMVVNKEVEASRILKEIRGIEKISLKGREIVCQCKPEKNLVKNIVYGLSREGVEIENIMEERKSLETVFLLLTGKKLRD